MNKTQQCVQFEENHQQHGGYFLFRITTYYSLECIIPLRSQQFATDYLFIYFIHKESHNVLMCFKLDLMLWNV